MTNVQQSKPEIRWPPPWVPPIFLEACEKHRIYDTASPFVQDNCLWATDGVILIRRKLTWKELTELPPALSCRPRWLPASLDIWRRFALLESLPHLAPLPPGNYEPTECSKCGGVGAYTAFADCEECDGEGMIESCFRVTIREEPIVVLLSRFVGLLLKHGVSCVAAGDTNDPVYFVSNGFEGLLMTCKETTK